MKAALKVFQLHVNYEKTPALWDISFEIPRGKLVGIVGPNGGGKSTLIKTMMGLIKPVAGKVSFFGLPLDRIKGKIGYVPQKESVDWNFPITVFDLVLMGRYSRLGLFHRPKKEDRDEVWKYLEKVGLKELSHRQISQLSGGQQQRAFIARALIQEADIYFLDEPFAGIDVTSSQVIMSLLRELKEKGKTLFVVHHDLNSVATTFDWVILLNMRLVACGEIKRVFTSELIEKTYGKENLLLDEATKLKREKSFGYLSL